METIEKINIRQMKADIKAKVEMQKFYKNQRKTVNKNNTKKPGDPEDITPSEATWKHFVNREDLRAMYAAYGVARGKSFSQVESQHQEEGHPLHQYQGKIDFLLKKYTVEVEVESEESGV
jgi:hypothetical protein